MSETIAPTSDVDRASQRKRRHDNLLDLVRPASPLSPYTILSALYRPTRSRLLRWNQQEA